MATSEVTVGVFDVHIGAEDKRFVRLFLKYLEAIKPDRVVLGGDIAEAESVSQHGGNPRPADLEREKKLLRKFLKAVRRAVGPKCEIIYLEGNHETRLWRFLVERAPTLAGLEELTWPSLLKLDKLKIRWVPTDEQPLKLGPVWIIHGHQIEGGGQYPARKLVDIWGSSGRTIVCGHFHQHQCIRRIMFPKPSVGIVTGCGRTKTPGWRDGPTGWQHGILKVQGKKVTVLDANDGVLIDGDKEFRA